ncbi:hypothetical protein [Flavobacterium columnare]|uniref:hypothetical protein n=1 Tax=Flavobacterium columnare TaxID=996 RepID=UPI0040332DED
MKNQNNFFKNTFAVFQISDLKEIENLTPDYISYKNKLVEDETYTRHLIKTDEVSSIYYYNEKGVYRLSNHWGGCSSCFWFLEERQNKTILETILETIETDNYKIFETLVLGFCSWNNFHDIIEKEVKEISEGDFFLAFEFNSLYFTRKLNDITPIAQHPNHKSSVVSIVDVDLK